MFCYYYSIKCSCTMNKEKNFVKIKNSAKFNEIEVYEEIRFFKVDSLAAHFEADQQKGGDYLY